MFPHYKIKLPTSWKPRKLIDVQKITSFSPNTPVLIKNTLFGKHFWERKILIAARIWQNFLYIETPKPSKSCLIKNREYLIIDSAWAVHLTIRRGDLYNYTDLIHRLLLI